MAVNVVALFAFLVGWFRGGHPERFGVAVLLFHALAEQVYHDWRIGDVFDLALWGSVARELAVGRVVLTLIFGWLAFRSPRWWPLPVTASLILILLAHLLTTMTPLSYNAGASARVGLWLLLYVFLLAGASERWLAGEVSVSRLGRDGAEGRRRSAKGDDPRESAEFPCP